MVQEIQNQNPIFNGPVKANMADMKKAFNGGINQENLQLIESIFNQCDIEGKVDANGKQVGDGELNIQERDNFFEALEKAVEKLPLSDDAKQNLLGQVASFLILVEISEDREKAIKETQSEIIKEKVMDFNQKGLDGLA